MYIQSKLTIGQLLSYYTYVAMLFALINDIAGMINSIQASLVTLEELEEFENNNQIIYNSNLLSNSEVKDVKFENISLNQVSFAYQNKVILKKINFSFKKNEHIAIVGASGVGKSTLVNIIINILKAQKGDIFLNNINYKNYTENDIMALFSVVNQNTFLFDTTIMENIYFEIGKEKKDIDTKLSFLRYINLKKDIYDLLNENVGANGGKLSGGQRQLISIARALNKDSNILILDEATSNLDSLTESYIQNILKEILDNEEKTIIVIGHRLSTLKSVDRIIVLKDGVIIEEGTWHSLKHNGTEFYRLFSDQIIKEEA
jgi:ATP-binding cassette subfamily B protein